MKLKEYVKMINDALEKDPSLAEMTVVHASDSEGNSFREVYLPEVWSCYFNEDDEYPATEDDWDEEYDGPYTPNAVVIN